MRIKHIIFITKGPDAAAGPPSFVHDRLTPSDLLA